MIILNVLKHCFLLLLGLLFVTNMFTQSQKQLIQYADENFEKGDYYGASLYYEKALKIDSVNIHLLYKYATSLRKYNNYTQAEYYFEKVVGKDDAGKIYPECIFWLGTMQKYNGKYKEAIKSYKRAQSIYGKDKKNYYYLKSKQEVISCNFAIRIKDQQEEGIKIRNVGSQVNTSQSEFGAFIHNDKMYFTSLRTDKLSDNLEVLEENKYKVSIYEAKYDSIWKTVNKIDTLINSTLSHSANGTFNKDGTIFIFTKCDSLNNCSLYSANLVKNKWSGVKILPEKINENGSITSHPSISFINGKEYLFFSSNRNGGKGDMDIWFVEILDGGTFSNPINAGKKINTPDPDITPFYHAESKTLYFSSSWHSGFGGFDIFKSVGELGNFSEPENLKKPINSQWNDFYYSIDTNSNNAYISSNRLGVFYEKGPTCCNDIWEIKFKNAEIEVPKNEIVSLDDLNKYLPVTLYFHNDRPGPKSLDTAVTDNYLKTYKHYKELQPTYRDEYSKGLEDQEKQDAISDIDDYFKYYVDKGVNDLNLFAKLLLEELEKGQKIEITIKGFASPLAKTDYNVNLTKRRISTLENYLREYDKGQYNSYIDKTSPNGGELSFIKIPFGEYTAASGISDDYYDQKNSVYNRKAALERKIEIQSVTYAKRDSVYAVLYAENGTQDFGKVKKGDELMHEFIITNTGNKPLRIENVISECDCIKVQYLNDEVLPGKTLSIKVTYNTSNHIGKQVRSITVIGDSFPKTKRLLITTEIFE